MVSYTAVITARSLAEPVRYAGDDAAAVLCLASGHALLYAACCEDCDAHGEQVCATVHLLTDEDTPNVVAAAFFSEGGIVDVFVEEYAGAWCDDEEWLDRMVSAAGLVEMAFTGASGHAVQAASDLASVYETVGCLGWERLGMAADLVGLGCSVVDACRVAGHGLPV